MLAQETILNIELLEEIVTVCELIRNDQFAEHTEDVQGAITNLYFLTKLVISDDADMTASEAHNALHGVKTDRPSLHDDDVWLPLLSVLNKLY